MLIKIFKIGIAILAVIMILVEIFMLLNSSLEAFPTLEQIEKARVGGIVLVSIESAVEAFIWGRVFKSKKKEM